MTIADFNRQISACHTVSELNSLLNQWSVLEGTTAEKDAAFWSWCQRREQFDEPAERGHDDAVQQPEAFLAR